MDFRFDTDELAAISGIADALRHRFPLDRLRDPAEPHLDAWSALAADGWLHAGLSAADGGLDLPPHMVRAFAREAGRLVCVDDWVNNAHLLPGLIATIDDPSTRQTWLAHQRRRPGFLLGDGRQPEIPIWSESTVATRWGYGIASGFDAYALTLTADSGHRLVRFESPELDWQPLGNLAPGVGRVEVISGVRDEARVGLDSRQLAAIASQAALLHSAALVGLAEAAVTRTAEYVKIRQQFGQPVGRFQAVKHLLADAYVRNEVAWNAVLYAALTVDSGSESVSCGGAISRMQAVEAASTATRMMLQLHGGIGFTSDSEVHYFLKTAQASGLRFGAREDHALALGRSVVGAA